MSSAQQLILSQQMNSIQQMIPPQQIDVSQHIVSSQPINTPQQDKHFQQDRTSQQSDSVLQLLDQLEQQFSTLSRESSASLHDQVYDAEKLLQKLHTLFLEKNLLGLPADDQDNRDVITTLQQLVDFHKQSFLLKQANMSLITKTMGNK